MEEWLQRYRWPLLAATLVVLLAGLVYGQLDRGEPTAIVFEQAPQLPVGAPIRVQVDGAVLAPGVYELHSGDRVDDAIAAAGGAAEDADTGSLNLARWLRDGEKLVVPAATGPVAAEAVATLAPGQLLDINTATAAQLDQLPGIGEAYSHRIVDSRLADGPYASIEDLLQRDVLPQATYDGIKDLIAVAP